MRRHTRYTRYTRYIRYTRHIGHSRTLPAARGTRHATRGLLAAAAAGAVLLALLPATAPASAATADATRANGRASAVPSDGRASTAPATGVGRPGGAPPDDDPWSAASYTPRPGDWRPYVLAPGGHTVTPVRVLSADPRGGTLTGDPDALLGRTARPLTLTGAPGGDRTASPLVTLDFGKEVGGKIRVHVAGASAIPPHLHVCFSESLRYAATTPTANSGEAAYAPGCDTANIWNGYPGQPYTYDSDSHTLTVDPAHLPATVTDAQIRGGFRYATLFLDGPGSIELGAASLQFGAAPQQPDPAAYRGWFLSSDNDLNKIWYAGAYTVQMDTWMPDTAKSWPYAPGEPDHADAVVPGADPGKEVILDGAKRDRVVWQGDLAVQAPVTYLTTGDTDAVDNSLSSLAGQQLADGFVPAESLVGQHNEDEIRTYGEYVTWFVQNHYDHWLYTGDTAYLKQWWPALTRATAWLESVRRQDPGGLIAFGDAGSCGHYGYSDCGHETYVNALYVRNLRDMAELATAQGDKAASGTYATRADAVAAAVNDQLWDPATGAYRLSRETPDAYPQDANATAVLTGVANQDQAVRAMDYLHRTSWSTYGALTVAPSTPNPSIQPFYEPLPSGFEASARLSLADPSGAQQALGLDLIRTFWGHQLAGDPGGTFWEKADPAGNPGIQQFTSLAHGWASGPTVSLTSRVLGVSPTGPGYATYDIAPVPGGLDWAQGAVPTPHGTITASWRAAAHGFTLTTDAPPGTHGRIAVPTGGRHVRVTLDGRTVWTGSHATAGAHATGDGSHVYLADVPPGRHTVTAR